jgi:hypothetical protein
VLTVFPPPDAPFQLDLQPNTYMLHGVPNAGGYDAFGLRRYSRFTGGMKEWGELFNPSQNLGGDRALDLLNVRFLIALRTPDGKIRSGRQLVDEKEIADRWTHAGQFGDLHVYENSKMLPRAWLATDVIVSPNEAATLETIRTGTLPDGKVWDPSRSVILEAPIEFKNHFPDASDKVSIEESGGHRIGLKSQSTDFTVLVLAENYYPGWVATVDGNEQAILRVNYNQRGLLLGPGNHNVEFVYRPASFSNGVTISLTAMLLLLIWWIWGSWKREPVRKS